MGANIAVRVLGIGSQNNLELQLLHPMHCYVCDLTQNNKCLKITHHDDNIELIDNKLTTDSYGISLRYDLHFPFYYSCLSSDWATANIVK